MATLRKPKSTSRNQERPRHRKPTAQHDARLDFRLSRDAKEKIEQAAIVTGQSLSDFAASTLVREAEQILEGTAATVLSDRDWNLFVALLQNPPDPGPMLRELVAEYRAHAQTNGDATTIDAAVLDKIPAPLRLDPH